MLQAHRTTTPLVFALLCVLASLGFNVVISIFVQEEEVNNEATTGAQIQGNEAKEKLAVVEEKSFFWQKPVFLQDTISSDANLTPALNRLRDSFEVTVAQEKPEGGNDCDNASEAFTFFSKYAMTVCRPHSSEIQQEVEKKAYYSGTAWSSISTLPKRAFYEQIYMDYLRPWKSARTETFSMVTADRNVYNFVNEDYRATFSSSGEVVVWLNRHKTFVVIKMLPEGFKDRGNWFTIECHAVQKSPLVKHGEQNLRSCSKFINNNEIVVKPILNGNLISFHFTHDNSTPRRRDSTAFHIAFQCARLDAKEQELRDIEEENNHYFSLAYLLQVYAANHPEKAKDFEWAAHKEDLKEFRRYLQTAEGKVSAAVFYDYFVRTESEMYSKKALHEIFFLEKPERSPKCAKVGASYFDITAQHDVNGDIMAIPAQGRPFVFSCKLMKAFDFEPNSNIVPTIIPDQLDFDILFDQAVHHEHDFKFKFYSSWKESEEDLLRFCN